MKSIFQNSGVQRLAIIAMACSFLLPIQFFTQIHLTNLNEGVDHSWMMGLSYAWQKGWIYGRDMIFTYGPLAFLSTRTYLSSNIVPLLVFDIYFILSAGVLFWEILKKNQNWKTSLMLLLTCFMYKNAMFLTLVFSLQILALLYFVLYAHKNSIWLLIQASIFTWLIFFIKLNMAYPAIVIWLIFTCYYGIKNLLGIKNVLLLVSFNIGLYVLSASFLPIDFWGYLKASWHLISAYDASVSIEILSNHIFYFSISCFCFLIFMGYLMYSSFRADSFTLVANLAFAMVAFIIFKSSCVRADLEHLKDFPFVFPPLVASYIFVRKYLLKKDSKKYLKYIRLESITLLAWAQAAYIIYLFGDTLYPVKKIVTLPAYLYNMAQGYDYYQNTSLRKLPENISQKIGNKTIDIMPWEVSTLVVNKLNYRPRPILQSYQPYDCYLDELNADKYASLSGPEYIIYTTNSIDKHYSFSYETQTKIALMENYVASDTFHYNHEPNILFVRCPRKKKTYKLLESRQSSLNDTIYIPKSKKHLLLKCNIDYSVLGQLRQLVFKSAQLDLNLSTKAGKTYRHKGAISLLKNGMLVDSYVDDVVHAFDYFRGISRDTNDLIKSVHLSADEPIYWQDSLQYWIYELD